MVQKSSLLALFLAGLAACSSGTTRCRDVCQREAQCVERSADEELIRFDQTECTAACKDLERDPEGSQLVARHAECVEKAESCEAVLACP